MAKRPHLDPSGESKQIREPILCVPKLLRRDLWAAAAEVAWKSNPLNKRAAERMLVPEFSQTPERIAVLTTKYWPTETQRLTVAFMDNPSAQLQKKILSHMNAWGNTINIEFVMSKIDPQIRIDRAANDGHWSYVGTDILEIPPDEPTMNLDSFAMKTPESEFRRVVRHETGHTLGCPHEHMRREFVELIDPEKAFSYYQQTQGWDASLVLDQVLTPIEESSVLGTEPPDPNSIMCYQIPGSITKSGKPILGGTDISASDYAFMATIYPKPAPTPVITQLNPDASGIPDYKEVLKKVEALVGGIFPEGKLQNRLLNLGLREFLEERAIEKYGFPFRFLTQLDEAILTLAYFLHRFKDEGGKLFVYGLNKLSKGEVKTLSYWMSDKAKLYIEIQNMILLLNEFEGRESKVTRIFALKNISEIAFLTQSAISTISEQRASGIRIGFLFTDTFKSDVPIDPISNTLIIHYEPAQSQGSSKLRPNFYELYEVPGRNNRHSLPYQQNCSSRWYRDFKQATKATGSERARARRLKALLSTFQEPSWTEFGSGALSKIHRFPHVGKEFFNSALVMMYKAYLESPKLRNLPSYRTEKIIERFNDRVVTQDLVRLERAMSTFDGDEEAHIRAVDPTSVKNTLQVHESDPTYRHWLRRGLNRVLRRQSNVQLERVYIVEDTISDKEEYDSLVRSMQYYLDYFHFEISELAGIANRHKEDYQRKPQKWEAEMWALLKNRVKIYVTSRSVLKYFWPNLPGREKLEKMLSDFSSDILNSSSDPLMQLTTLDFLSTDDMIYAFDNPTGDPGELQFNAYLLRKNLDTRHEEDILFDFSKEQSLQPLLRQQKLERMKGLIDSITEYRSAYKSVDDLKERFKDLEDRIQPLRERLRNIFDLQRSAAIGGNTLEKYLEQHPEIFIDDPRSVLDIRKEAESMLFEYFAPRVDYFFKLLRHMSVEVRFFDNMESVDIREVYPFNRIDGKSSRRNRMSEKLAELIKASVDAKTFPRPPTPEPAQPKLSKAMTGQVNVDPVPRIKILVLAANPIGTPFFHFPEELHRISRSVLLGKEERNFEVREDTATRVADLQRHLFEFEPSIVHLSAHTDPKAGLLLMDEAGKAKAVTVNGLKEVFALHNQYIRCVVINSCNSKQFAEAIAEEIDCVIGMSEAIKDEAAMIFSAAFYKALSYRQSVQTAFKSGLAELELERQTSSHIPILVSLRKDPSEIYFLPKD
jgi:hypothetical protein